MLERGIQVQIAGSRRREIRIRKIIPIAKLIKLNKQLHKSIQVLIFFNFSVNLHLRDVQCRFNKIIIRLLAKSKRY